MERQLSHKATRYISTCACACGAHRGGEVRRALVRCVTQPDRGDGGDGAGGAGRNGVEMATRRSAPSVGVVVAAARESVGALPQERGGDLHIVRGGTHIVRGGGTPHSEGMRRERNWASCHAGKPHAICRADASDTRWATKVHVHVANAHRRQRPLTQGAGSAPIGFEPWQLELTS